MNNGTYDGYAFGDLSNSQLPTIHEELEDSWFAPSRVKKPISKFTLGKSSMSKSEYRAWNQELARLKRLNLLTKTESAMSVKSEPAFAEETSRPKPKSAGYKHKEQYGQKNPLDTLCHVPAPERRNLLESLIQVFPMTVSTNEFANFISSKVDSSITKDLTRSFEMKKSRHKQNFVEFLQTLEFTRTRRILGWFENLFSSLFIVSSDYLDLYAYIFEMKKQQEENALLQRWQSLNSFFKWSITGVFVFVYFTLMCLLIDSYDIYGVNVAVPLTLFVTVVLNVILMNMNSCIPNEF